MSRITFAMLAVGILLLAGCTHNSNGNTLPANEGNDPAQRNAALFSA